MNIIHVTFYECELWIFIQINLDWLMVIEGDFLLGGKIRLVKPLTVKKGYSHINSNKKDISSLF